MEENEVPNPRIAESGNSMKQTPNLFQFATKELSQDAFICWALAWADNAYAITDPALHRMGQEMMRAMFAKHSVDLPSPVTIEIQQQFHGLDILVLVGERDALLIEDKIHSSEHSDQLQRYLDEVRTEYPDRRLLPIFAKTGDQSTYGDVVKAKYQTFLRGDFLACLRRSADSIENAIFENFLANLEARDRRINAFRQDPFSNWQENGDGWTGFYEHLQSLRNEDQFSWNYVSNPNGGFMGAWWHFRKWGASDVYLQIEEGPLCFKISPPDNHEKYSTWRNSWHEYLMASPNAQVLGLKRPRRFGNGECMTVAQIDTERWIKLTDHGYLDIDATLQVLTNAEALIDDVLSRSPCPY